jgi:molybdenum-dependent DNA-binding transcriptional regulator ModE
MRNPFMPLPLVLAGLAWGVFGAAQAQPMGAADVTAAQDRIGATYRVAREACNQLSSNAKDICVEEAKGQEKIGRAELQYNRSRKPEDMARLATARAEAAYEVAKERCDDRAGNDKDVCMEQAKAAQVRAKSDAKVSKETGEITREAAADRRDADYQVAAEKCDALAGDAKSACLTAAKARFGKN